VGQPDLPGFFQSLALKTGGVVHHVESITDNLSFDKLGHCCAAGQHALAFSSILGYNSAEIAFEVW
jgi:hypothetical protein